MIATKIAIPRRRHDTLRRARLLDAIHQLIDRQLYLVVAPAGYGKTTLLVDFASDSDVPVCWYSLSPDDSEPARFLDYLIAAIHARFPRFGADTRRVLAQTNNLHTDAPAVVAALVNEVQKRIPDYFAVVLDDYHEVNDHPAINQLVDALLRYAPENLKLIIASRSMPRLQLSRLAAQRQAAGVGARDLRFTSDEVRDLMRDAYQTVLPDRVVEELTARSEGWITGIILTTHTMWQGLFESMIRNSGQEQLYSYLASEVFTRQTPAVQRFLLCSSVLDDMEPAIAGPLARVARPERIFQQLQDGNLFLTELEGRRRVYRYHHLFRDFLRSRLDDGALGLSRSELELRAGRLFQQRQQHEQAIGHLLAAEAFEEAATSILAVAEDIFNAGRLDTLAGWIDRLPAQLRELQPMLCVWRAQLAIQKGDLQLGIDLCREAYELAERSHDRVLQAEVEVHWAAALRLSGDNEQAIRRCERALSVFGDEVSRRRALALRNAGVAYWRLGQFEAARARYVESHAVHESLGDKASAAYLRIDLGVAAMYLGELGEARHQLSRSAAFWERSGNAGRHGLALGNLGVVAYLEEQYEEANQLLETALNRSQAGLFPYAEALAAVSLGDVYRDLGAYDHADRLYSNALSLAEASGDQNECATALWSMANGLRLQGNYPRAEATVRRAMKLASGYRLAQLKLTAGVCAVEEGRYRRAGRLLDEAHAAFVSGSARYPAARALFHQAILRFRLSDIPGSDRKLNECLTLLEELGFAQFLSVDGRRCLPFLEQAVLRGIGEHYLKRLLRHLKRRPAPASEPVFRAEPNRVREIAVRALGAGDVRVDDTLVSAKDWGAQSARELFLYLLLHRDGVSRDQLLAALAPESSEARANSQFHVAAFRIRRALYKGCVQFVGDGYQLDPDLECDFDVEEFVSACSAARDLVSDPDAEVAALERACLLYAGPFLPGSYSEWVLEQRAALEEQFLIAGTRLARLHLVRGEFDAAQHAAERVLVVDNSLEEVHEITIRALVSSDRLAEAQHHLNSYEAYLHDELDVELPSSLRELVTRPRANRRLALV